MRGILRVGSAAVETRDCLNQPVGGSVTEGTAAPWGSPCALGASSTALGRLDGRDAASGQSVTTLPRIRTSWDGIDSHGTGQVPPVRDWDATRNRDTSRPIGTGLNCPSPPCEREEIAQNGTGFNWDGTRTLGRGTKSGPDSGLRRSNQMSPAVIFGRQRLTADNCPVRTLSRKEGTAGGTGLGRWDGTSCFTEKSPEKSAPSPRPLYVEKR